MKEDNPTDSKNQFLEKVKENYLQGLERLKGHAGSWSIRRPVLALSGGPDSTALLMALNSLEAELGIKIRPIHINHRLRDSESDLDQEFCQNLCEKLGLSLEVMALPDHFGSSPSEDTLRNARYERLLEFANSIDSALILTGHTMDDQLETMLFRMFRGTSPTGLLGMADVRQLAPKASVWLLRPLLSLEKIECLKYLAESETQAREDSTNKESSYDRNYIRHQVIPVIEDRFRQWKRSLLRLHDVISVEEDYFSGVVEAQIKSVTLPGDFDEVVWQLSKLRDVHKAVLRRMIANQFKSLQLNPSYERISFVVDLVDCQNATGAVTLSDRVEARLESDKLIFRLNDNLSDENRYAFLANQSTTIRFPELTSERGSCSNLVPWLNSSLRVSRFSDETWKYPPQRALIAFVDLRDLSSQIQVRVRLPGDCIQPFGMEEMVRLKKYLHTHKPLDSFELPQFQRNLKTVVVVANGEEVLWVPGFGISEKMRAKGKPSYVMEWVDISSGGPVIA